MSILSYFQELVSLIKEFAEFGLYLATGPSVLVAGFAAVGGLFAGPLGALCGGMAGSTLNSFMSNSLNPAIGVLNNLSFAQKKLAVFGVQALVGSVFVAGLVTFMANKRNRDMIYGFLKDNFF